MGPGIEKGARVMGLPTSVFDIAPTILHLYGIPVPQQMQGRVLTEIFETELRETAGDVPRTKVALPREQGHHESHWLIPEAQ